MHALEEIFPPGGSVERADDVHGRGFARPRRSHDGDEFALMDREINAVKRCKSRLPGAVALPDAAEFNKRDIRHSSTPRPDHQDF